MFQKFEVFPSEVGFLYENAKFIKECESGVYNFFSLFKSYKIYKLITAPQNLSVTNQEMIIKDSIALRFSFSVEFEISQPNLALKSVPLLENPDLTYDINDKVLENAKIFVRDEVAGLCSDKLIERNFSLNLDALKDKTKSYGVEILGLDIIDITFPKNIQEIYAKRLEAKVRGETELENARTTVATARALKNAANLLKDDENVKFLQLLELLNKSLSSGKHSFNVGEILK